jgi:hypothetical protein
MRRLYRLQIPTRKPGKTNDCLSRKYDAAKKNVNFGAAPISCVVMDDTLDALDLGHPRLSLN